MNSRTQFACAVEQSVDGARRLVATRDVEAGTLLLMEEPIIEAPILLSPSHRAWKMVIQLLTQKETMSWFLQMGFKLTPQIWDAEDERLSGRIAENFGTDRSAVRNLYFRVATNHLGYFVHDDVAGSGLYKTLCFSNHSCAPNSTPATASAAFRHAALQAIESIRSGAEITWSYAWPSGLEVSRRKRQAMLRSDFGFDCRCHRCNQER